MGAYVCQCQLSISFTYLVNFLLSLCMQRVVPCPRGRIPNEIRVVQLELVVVDIHFPPGSGASFSKDLTLWCM